MKLPTTVLSNKSRNKEDNFFGETIGRRTKTGGSSVSSAFLLDGRNPISPLFIKNDIDIKKEASHHCETSLKVFLLGTNFFKVKRLF